MKKVKPWIDILTSYFSLILSIALVIITVAFGLYVPLRKMGTPKRITAVASKIDIDKLTKENPEFLKLVDRYKFSSAQVDRLLNSDTAKDIVELYTNDINVILQSKDMPMQFNSQNIKQIVFRDYNELVEVMKLSKYTKYLAALKENEIKLTINRHIDDIVSKIPTADKIYKNTEDTGYTAYIDALKLLTNPLFFKCFIIALTGIAVLIFCLRHLRFEGLLWLGVDFAISSVILIAATVASDFGVAEYIISKFLPKGAITKAAIDIFNRELILQCVVFTAITVVMIVAYFLLKKYCLKTKTEYINVEIADNGQFNENEA